MNFDGHNTIKMGEYRWWNPGIEGIGVIKVKVAGIASHGAPLIGKTYIVELPSWTKLDVKYDYTHLAAFECHLHESHPFGIEQGDLAHFLVCPWCDYKRHRIDKGGSKEVLLKCGNTKCERVGIITLDTWKKIEKCQ